jgi:serine/threonine protein kinase
MGDAMDVAMMTQRESLLAGRYQMGQLLGSGGFGAVYLATDERLRRSVAIKVCSTRWLPPHEADEAAHLFQREALTLAQLRHPGLTAIWDYFSHDDSWYLVMEYVPGQTLRDLLRQVHGPLPQAEAIDYARQLCAVLGYLHTRQPPIVFRDLKPANIMVTPDGHLKLIDFGIARLFSPDKAADTAQFGTPGYAPPEQYGGQTEPRSDIYSLGVVLHQMLTGHNPTATPFALPPAHTLNAAIPASIDHLLARATAYHIDDRISSAEEFSRELSMAISQPASMQTAPAPHVPVHATTHQHSGQTARQQLWSPAPRHLPNRPASGQGFGRTLTLIILLALLLGGLGTGAFLLKEQLSAYAEELLRPIVVPPTPSTSEIPQTVVFSAIDDDRAENLYQINTATGTRRQLTNFPLSESASQPSISPDGTLVAFNRESRSINQATQAWNISGSEVWLMSLSGQNMRRVASHYPFARAAAWSPDGHTLAVEVAEANRAWMDHDIVLVDVETGVAQPLVTSPQWEGGPTWSPDGSQIAYQSRPSGMRCMQLFVINVNGNNATPLTDLQGEQCAPRGSGAYWPDWSPDGTRIAFGLKVNELEQLAILHLETGDIEVLATGSEPASFPRWSRDGRHLLFQQGKDADVSLARYDTETQHVARVDTSLRGSHLADWR